MKKAVFICFFTCLLFSVSAQSVEKYLEVSITPKWKRGMRVNIYFGEDSTLFAPKDKTIKEKIMLAEKYHSTIDVLNYLSSLGWSLVSAFPSLQGGDTVGYLYYLKKKFDRSEMSEVIKVD